MEKSNHFIQLQQPKAVCEHILSSVAQFEHRLILEKQEQASKLRVPEDGKALRIEEHLQVTA